MAEGATYDPKSDYGKGRADEALLRGRGTPLEFAPEELARHIEVLIGYCESEFGGTSAMEEAAELRTAIDATEEFIASLKGHTHA